MGVGCGGLGEGLGGRTGTPSPGRVPAAWPCDRLAIMVLAHCIQIELLEVRGGHSS